MQVSVESLGGIERRITVQVPVERIEEEIEGRLKSMAGRARIDGFRPGKAPLKVVRQRYGEGVYEEVINELLGNSFREAVAKEELRLVGDPAIESVDAGPGKPLNYQARFDVMPVFEIADLSSVEISRPVAEVTDEDIDRLIETLREQRAQWDPVEREAREGDRVRIDYEGKIDGEPFSGNKSEDMNVILGKGHFLPEFEGRLVGRKAGDEFENEFTFPDDYGSGEVAGKTAVFDVKVKAVEEMRLPEVDEEFARGFGIDEGGVAALRESIATHMHRELEQAIKSRIKRQVMDILHDNHEFDLPKSLIAGEIDRLRQDVAREMKADPASVPDNLFEGEAKRRVALGLIISEIIRSEEITADQNRLRAAMESMASTYDDPQAVLAHYQGNPHALAALEAIVVEDQVVDWVLDAAKVVDQPSSFREVTSRDGEAGQ